MMLRWESVTDVGSARDLEEFANAGEDLGIVGRERVRFERVLDHQFEARGRCRLVEGDERASVRQGHQHHAMNRSRVRVGLTTMTAAAAESGEFRGRVRSLADFGLGDADHRRD